MAQFYYDRYEALRLPRRVVSTSYSKADTSSFNMHSGWKFVDNLYVSTMPYNFVQPNSSNVGYETTNDGKYLLERSYKGTPDTLYVVQYKIGFYYSKGDYIETITGEHDQYPLDGPLSHGWYIRQGLSAVASITNIEEGQELFTIINLLLNKTSSDTKTNIEFSSDGGVTWKRIASLLTATSYSHDFRNEVETINAKLRTQSVFDGVSPTYYGDWVETDIFTVRYNTPPPIPSYFTIDVLRAGRQDIIEWENVIDADNDAITYILERSVNEGSYVEIYRDIANSYTETIPTLGWQNVKYRVKAYDNREYSDYLVSDLIIIKYFAEFEVLDNGILRQSDKGWVANNNIAREIDTIHIRVNNELQEV